MTYSTNDDLLKEITTAELARLTGDRTGQNIDTDKTDYARSNADGLIDAYLYGRYNIPFEGPIDPVIKKLSIDLTISNLYEYYYKNSTIPTTIVWRRLNALKLLKDIQEGCVSLQNLSAGTNAPPPIVCNKSEDDRIFNDDVLDEFC